MKKADIPQIVYDAFKESIEESGESGLKYLGERDSKKYYTYEIPISLEIGFPQVIALKGGEIEQIHGYDALRVLDLFRK